MTLQQRKELETYFIENMEIEFPAVPLFFENDGGTPPKPEPGARWCKFIVINNSNYPAALGHSFRRLDGMLSIQIFTVRGEGANPADEIADFLETLYDGTCVNRTRFTTGVVAIPSSITNAPTSTTNTTAGGAVWYQKNITVTFTTDYTKE